MSGNVFGELFRLASFGESPGKGIGGVVDGCPPGIVISLDAVERDLGRRRPGFSSLVSARREVDKVELLSGIFEGKTTGMPIAFFVKNEDQDSSAYDDLREVYRPSHADYSWKMKYGIRDYRGGGRASAREHIARIVGGSIAKQVLAIYGISVRAYTSSIGELALDRIYYDATEEDEVRCPEPTVSRMMAELIRKADSEGDSIGGCVTCILNGMPAGIGEPVFDRLEARLAYAALSINAAKGFEYGSGFEGAKRRGSRENDPWGVRDGKITALSNNSGGIQGGISNGEPVIFRVAFKPTPTISVLQHTVDCEGRETTVSAMGRHDPCVVPRAVPVVEAMAAMTVVDMLLAAKRFNPDGFANLRKIL